MHQTESKVSLLSAELSLLKDDLHDLKKLSSKESTTLALNIKHTSKLLLEFSELKAKHESLGNRFASKSDLGMLANKSVLQTVELV